MKVAYSATLDPNWKCASTASRKKMRLKEHARGTKVAFSARFVCTRSVSLP